MIKRLLVVYSPALIMPEQHLDQLIPE
jgi:hypothetical protein